MKRTIHSISTPVNGENQPAVNYDEHPLVVKSRNYEYVTDIKRAWSLLKSLDPYLVYGLDFETTSLFPAWGKVRLTSVAGNGVQFIIDHHYCGDFAYYAEFISERMWAVFNSCFEGDWIDTNADNNKVRLYDVGHMRRAKMGGGPLSLKTQCKMDLKLELVKDEQNSSWGSTVLTKSQLDYAMLDAVATFALWEKWDEELDENQWNGFLVINDSWRGTVEMQYTGLVLDVEYHKKLVKWWILKRDTVERYLKRWTPPSVIENLRSKKQISDFLKRDVLDDRAVRAWPKTGKTGQLDLTRDVLRQAAHRLPYPVNRWIAALIMFNKMDKYIGTYGQKLIDKQIKLGKITTRFNIAQAITGRYSSSAENLQNIPNNPIVRRSFICPTSVTGNEVKLIMADYSSIEVRVLAELAKDKQLLEDAINNVVHNRSASKIYAIDFDYFHEVITSDNPKHNNAKPAFIAMRRTSKSFTFQLLYGAGGPALAVVLRCTDEEAFKAIDGWASLYPRAYHYRQIMYEKMMHSSFLPVTDGRTIFVYKQDRSMPVAANWPVQGAAASVMYRAVYHTNRLLYDANINCKMAASVHDELLLFSHEDCAEQASSLLVTAMVQGWLDIFPDTNTDNLVGKGNHATIGTNWGEK